MTRILLPPLMLYAACGLVLSLLEHILSFFAVQLAGDALFTPLIVGIFPLWLPVVLIVRRMTGGHRGLNNLRAALAGAPRWMSYAALGFTVYAVFNFFVFIALTDMHPAPSQPNAASKIAMVHLVSGHCMAFYSAGLVALTSAYYRGLSNLRRRCPLGHNVSWSQQSCPTCGATIAALPDRS